MYQKYNGKYVVTRHWAFLSGYIEILELTITWTGSDIYRLSVVIYAKQRRLSLPAFLLLFACKTMFVFFIFMWNYSLFFLFKICGSGRGLRLVVVRKHHLFYVNAHAAGLGNPGLTELVDNQHRDTAYVEPRLLG